MADRRMFAKTIVLSDDFLDMPATARCLYFTLSMFADDDGFVNNPRSIVRQCGTSNDDLNVLIAKKFVIPFETGVIVIRHWRLNNYLRSDRYNPTKFVNEKNKLSTDESGAYFLDNPEAGIPVGIPSVNQMVYPDKVSIGKVSTGKDSNNISSGEQSPPTQKATDTKEAILERFNRFWAAYPVKTGKGAARKSWNTIQPSEKLTGIMLAAVERQQREDQRWLEGFIPNPATWLNQARWEDEPVTQRKGKPKTKPFDEREIKDSDFEDGYFADIMNRGRK